MIYYATADKSRLVPADDPEARYTVNDADPGEFAQLLAVHLAETAAKPAPKAPAKAQEPTDAEEKAQRPAEDKAEKAPAQAKASK